jgi:redox-sensing transcriptional repressor
MPQSDGIPLPTLRRLPFYLRILREREDRGDLWITSDEIAKRLGLGAIQVRKDLGSIGAVGRAKYGYPVAETARAIGRFLGTDTYSDVFVIGAGPLGAAVVADENVARHHMKISAVFEYDPVLIGSMLYGHRVLPLFKMSDFARRLGVKIAVLAIDASGLRAAVDEITRSDLAGILDLTGLGASLPERLIVVREDFGSTLASLAVELGRARGG